MRAATRGSAASRPPTPTATPFRKSRREMERSMPNSRSLGHTVKSSLFGGVAEIQNYSSGESAIRDGGRRGQREWRRPDPPPKADRPDPGRGIARPRYVRNGELERAGQLPTRPVQRVEARTPAAVFAGHLEDDNLGIGVNMNGPGLQCDRILQGF